MMSEQAKLIINMTGVDKLPSLPHVLLKLLHALNTENEDFEQLASLISQDPALYTRFLYISNLSGNHQHPVETLLSEIGFATIKNIINTSAVQQFFSPYSHEKVEFLKQHWQHSLLCAEVSRMIAEEIGLDDSAAAYVAGLTHDIGQLALESAYPKQYTSTFAQLSENEYFHTLEKESFDTTHQQVSNLILRDCGINRAISDAVLFHHEEIDLILDAHHLVKIINLANQLSNADFKTEDVHVLEAAERLLVIPQAQVLMLLERARARVSDIATTLEMDFKADGIDGETASKIDGDDELKQVQLAEQVRNIALFDSAQQSLNGAATKSDAVKNIELQAGLLFSVENVILFEYEEENNQVVALSSNPEPDFLDDLSIPMEQGRSLVTEALINKEPKHSFDTSMNTTVIDQQLAGLNDSEGLLCIPTLTVHQTTGVLVFGVSQEQQKQLWKQRSLLSRFANSITRLLRTNSETSGDTSAEIAVLEKTNREIAHEIRNPLSVINNYLEILSVKLDDENESHQNIDTIRSEISRIGSILEKLSSPATATAHPALVNINTAISDLTQIFLSSLAAEKTITIELQLDDDMPQITCDINSIKQIYTNLIKNAIEALPTNGQILVYTSSNVNVNGQEFIEISVTDNGPGIADTVLPGLFSPVQTTKGDDHSGLGLTIVKDLVSDLNGTISCKSSKQGTSFHILLPKEL